MNPKIIKALYIAGGLAGAWVLAYIVVWVYARVKSTNNSISTSSTPADTVTTTTTVTTTSTSTASKPKSVTEAIPLKWGSDTRSVPVKDGAMTGVRLIQYYLNNLALVKAGISQDGIWGRQTEAAIDKCRKAYASLAAYISPVVSPANGQSHWQFSSVSDYNRFCIQAKQLVKLENGSNKYSYVTE